MKRSRKKNFLIILLTITVASSVAFYLVWNKPHRNIDDAKAMEINAAALYDTLSKQDAKSISTLVNTIVLVSGSVEKVLYNQNKQQVVYLKTPEDDGYINCTMEEPVATIKEGDEVKIKGICSGYIAGEFGLAGDVFLIRSHVLQ
jgi:hypothetical protein